MITYEKKRPYSGNAGRALEFMSTTLLSIGFDIELREPNRLVATKALKVISRAEESREYSISHDLDLVTRIDIRADGSTLSAQAEFGGLAGFLWFLAAVFGLAILVCIATACLVFSGQMHFGPHSRMGQHLTNSHGRTVPPLAGLLPLAMGLFLPNGFLKIYRPLRNKAAAGVDSLLNNAAEMAS